MLLLGREGQAMGSGFEFESTPFYFLRHGETPENQAGILQGQIDTALNASGRKTAEEAGRLLADRNLGSIHASPLKRAWSTAFIVSVLTKAPKFPVPGLMERHWGVYEGKPKSERPSERNPETVETLEAFADRVIEAMRSIDGPSPVLVVAHSGVFRVLARYLGFAIVDTTSVSGADLVLFEPPSEQHSRWHISAVSR